MGNLATILTVALVCAAFGFVAGSMLTSIWIDRHSKPTRAKRKTSEKNGKEIARVLLNSDTDSIDLEIDGEMYRSNQLPPASVLEKLKSTNLLMERWYRKDEIDHLFEEPKGKTDKDPKMKSLKKESKEKPEEHDMLFEINNIIQEKVKSSSNIDRKIRLAREGMTGVSFWVGESNYTTIDAIPDHQVKDLIKGAVAEWEAHVG
jgi:hypothetical protein